MRNTLKRAAAASVCGAMLLSMSGCADTSWSVKSSDGETLSVGTYIYYMSEAYSEAKDETEKQGNEVLTTTIDDKTGDEWIRDRAKELCVEQLTIDKLCKDNGITVTDDDIDSAYTDTSVFYGYYSYSDMWVMSKSTYEAMGISEESYKNAIIKTALEKDELFVKLYGEGGTDEVTDEEIQDYFTENYVSYSYLYSSLNTTDDDGNSTTLSDEEKEVLEEKFARYVKMINEEDKTLDDVAEQYDEDNADETTTEETTDETSTDETSTDEMSTEESSAESSAESSTESTDESSAESSTESSEESSESSESSDSTEEESTSMYSDISDISVDSDSFSLGEEVQTKLKEMEEGEAAYVETSYAFYFLYKSPIADEVSTYLDDDDTYGYASEIRHTLKDDTFDEYIEEQADKLDYEFNDAAASKYTPSRVIPESDNSVEESSEDESSEESSEDSETSEESTESSIESTAESSAEASTEESTAESSAEASATESTAESSAEASATESTAESSAEASATESAA